jgi:archaeosine synthase
MQLKIKAKDELGRIGKFSINDKQILTPNILFVNTSRFKAPDFADIILSNIDSKTKKLVLKTTYKEILEIKDDKYYFESREGIIISKFTKQFFERPKKFVDFIVDLKQKIGPGKTVFAPGIATPSNLALLCYLGIDLFDSSSAIIAARENKMFFSDGKYRIEELSELPCNCPVCSSKKDSSELDFKDILNHNYYMIFNELKQVRNMIKNGNLRNYVEKKVQTDPLYATILRDMSIKHYNHLEENTPVVSNKTIYATSKESFNRPEIKRFQKRVIERYCKPDSAKILLLLPCSAKKPYSFSKSHKFFRRKILETSNPDLIHEMIITSPLGLVPRELELTYPAANYDIPVTGVWDEDEKKMINSLLSEYLSKNKYEKIILHLPSELTEFIKEEVANPVISCIDHPTSDDSLENLYKILQESISSFEKVNRKDRQRENINSIAAYQFGKNTAEVLLKNTKISGRYPMLKITENDKQIGMLIGEKGYISLTFEGAEKISDICEYKVEISEDFKPKGSILSPGVVDADKSIRIGDEILIFRKKSIIGVGVACMNGSDMINLNYGEAIKTRHIHS